jgi:PKD repeat protein
VDHKNGDVGALFKFTDKSKGGPTSWRWDFGDGTPPSDEQNPTHIYWDPNPNGYQVTLTVSNAKTSASMILPDRIRIYEPLEARFSADKVSGPTPLTVQFKDESLGGSGINGWLWDFGDGTPPSNQQNPTHTYSNTGNYTVSLTITRADGKTDPESKNSFINAYKKLIFNHKLLVPLYKSTIKDNSVYYKGFAVAGGTSVNTNISANKYVCGIAGFSAHNGYIIPFRVYRDGLRVFMSQKQGTWWIFAEFQQGDVSPFPKEVWGINVVCFDRSMEGTAFISRDFKNITGGISYDTDLSTTTYFNCGIMGMAGLGVTGFRPNWYSEVALDVRAESHGDSWRINSKMDVIDGGDIWDINLLCLKQKSYMNDPSPPFLVKDVYLSTSISNKAETGISATDYICGVNGYKAERVILFAFNVNPLNLNSSIAADLLTVNTIVENGYWSVYADIAHRSKAEDWTVNVLCVRKGLAVEGMPPN